VQVDWGILVVLLMQPAISRGAMHILETYAGVVLVDHIVVRCKFNGVWKFEVHYHGLTQEGSFAF
jgi:hypothetical protein